MNCDGAPYRDGFSGFFFKKYWYIVVVDVFNAVRQLFDKGWIFPNYNSKVGYQIVFVLLQWLLIWLIKGLLR